VRHEDVFFQAGKARLGQVLNYELLNSEANFRTLILCSHREAASHLIGSARKFAKGGWPPSATPTRMQWKLRKCVGAFEGVALP
jgi:hypothetical protein